MTYKVGDRVRWESSNTKKEGVIIEVIDAKTPINNQKYKGFRNAGGPRDHHSYVIKGNEIDNKTVRLYWPRVSLLEPETPPADFLVFDYVNHRGVDEKRRVKVMGMRFGTSEYYPVAEWLMQGHDLDRNAPREFAVRKMRAVT